jgi:hypothetical protein
MARNFSAVRGSMIVQGLREIGAQLVPELRADLEALAKLVETGPLAVRGASRMEYDTFRPENIGSRGKSSDPISALRGWLVAEADRHVPTATTDRNAAIADLLVFAGLTIKSDAVNSILTTRKRFRGGDLIAAARATFARLPTPPSSNTGIQKRPRY